MSCEADSSTFGSLDLTRDSYTIVLPEKQQPTLADHITFVGAFSVHLDLFILTNIEHFDNGKSIPYT